MYGKGKINDENKTITVSSSQVELVNIEDGMSGQAEDKNIQVVIKGDKSQLENIKANDIHLRGNCDDMGIGTHSIKLYVICNKKNSGITVIPNNIRVRISQE